MIAATTDDTAIDEYDLLASIVREDFFEFVREFWSEVSTEVPIWNWHIPYLCDELAKVAERVFKGESKEYDLIINIPPGTTKSTVCSIMFPAWVWTRMPHAKFICASNTHDLVLDHSRKCRDIVLSDKYLRCFPEIRLRGDQNTKGHFANTKKGSRQGFTVSGKNPVGFHAHFLIVDDPLDAKKALSELEVKAANNFMNETLPSRKINKDVTRRS